MLSNEVVDKSAIIGENLRIWRKLLNLTSNQMAQRAGVSTLTYLKIERGDKGVSIGNVLSAMRGLGILDTVVGATDPYNSDLGRARADLKLPKRVRNE